VKVIEAVNHPSLRALPDFANSMAPDGDAERNYKGVEGMFKHAFNMCHVKKGWEDHQGKLHPVDLARLFAIARHRATKEKLGGVAGTLMTNFAFEKAMTRLGIAFARAKVGDRYVLELMRAKGWQLGGENSGHIICLDKHTTGDGIVSALQVLHAMRESGRSARMLYLTPRFVSPMPNGRRGDVVASLKMVMSGLSRSSSSPRPSP